MKSINFKYGLLIAIMSLTQISMVHSENYFGASVGQSEVDVPGYDEPTSYKIFGGLREDSIGVELAYIDIGEFKISGPGGTGSIDVFGIELSAVGFLPVGDNFDLLGKIGLFYWEVDATLNNAPFGSNDGTDLAIGFGGQFKATDNLALRAEYQIFNDVDDSDIDMISVGISFNF